MLFYGTYEKRINIAGMLFGIYMVVNGLERFLIEKIRVNTKYILFGQEITQAELISLAMIIIGLAIVYRLYTQLKKMSNDKIKISFNLF